MDREQIRNSYIGFSQFGEDRLIETILPEPNGFYVDAGCHHPDSMSNTLVLYLKGWRGINIDAREEAIRVFESKRPRDINLCAAVSDEDGKHVQFTVAKSGLTSSLYNNGTSNDVHDVRNMITARLTSILEQFDVPFTFDYLNIDAEGADMDVLSGLDFGQFAPALITIEAWNFDALGDIHTYLAARGYRLISLVHWTAFFVHARVRGNFCVLSDMRK